LLLVPAAAAACAAMPAPPSPSAGERAYQKCYSCHALEPGRQLEGPPLHRIIGKPVAAEPGFVYSPAMKRFAATHPRWTRELLDRFAADPEGLVPGTSMAFFGMADAAERKALLDYLESLSGPKAPARPRS
jgi:cytochrome c